MAKNTQIIRLTAEDQLRLTSYIMEDAIALRMPIARALGDDVLTCLFFSQLYFLQRNKDPRLLKPRVEMVDDGWVWKTREEWRADTCLSREQQETARKKLKALGLLEERNDRMNHRMFYRLIPETLFPFFHKAVRAEGEVTIPPSRGLEEGGLGDNPTFGEVTIPPSSIYENTDKNIPATPEAGLKNTSVSNSSTPSVIDLPPTTSAAAPPFDSDSYCLKLMDDPKPHIRYIGDLIEARKLRFPSSAAVSAFITRQARVASAIVKANYSKEAVWALLDEMSESKFWSDKDWDLNNVMKQLPGFLSRNPDLT